MVGGDDYGERGHDRVRHGQPAPLAPERADDRDRHENGPAHVHGRHRGQLVGVEAGHVGVDRLVVDDGCVDHSGARQHAGGRHRYQLDDQAEAREGHQRRAPPAVVRPVPDEQPDHAGDQHGKVQDVVVQVEELDEERMRKKETLQPCLARQANVPLEPPDPAGPADRAIGTEGGQRSGILPQRVQAQDEAGLERAGCDLGEQRPTSGPESKGSDPKPDGRLRCVLPVQSEIDHSGCLALHVTRSDYGLMTRC